MIYLDTHVVVWLYAGRVDLIPPFATALIDGNDLRISPIVALELQYLYEVKRVTRTAADVLGTLSSAIGLQWCDLPFADVASAACAETWTRDPFDRIIVAQARIRAEPLLTKDRTIRRRYGKAMWDRARG